MGAASLRMSELPASITNHKSVLLTVHLTSKQV